MHIDGTNQHNMFDNMFSHDICFHLIFFSFYARRNKFGTFLYIFRHIGASLFSAASAKESILFLRAYDGLFCAFQHCCEHWAIYFYGSKAEVRAIYLYFLFCACNFFCFFCPPRVCFVSCIATKCCTCAVLTEFLLVFLTEFFRLKYERPKKASHLWEASLKCITSVAGSLVRTVVWQKLLM